MDKNKIFEEVYKRILDKIKNLENLILETRASNNDTKSSMGDKYETGREMLQQEINNLQMQLNELLNQKIILESFKKTNLDRSAKVENGALVQTENGLFFVSVSAGEIIFENQKIFTVSPESPLAKAMWGKTESETFILNGKKQTVKKIW